MTTEQTLALLLHSHRARHLWRTRGPSALGASPEAAADLATLDPEALERCAAALRRHLLERRHVGIGTIVDVFPLTIVAWRARHPTDDDLDDLATAFLESSAAARWRETQAENAGTPLEEAFYEFATAEKLGDPADRQRERLTVLIRMLAVDDEPAYEVPACIRRLPGIAWAMDEGDPPTLYATVNGQILIGPVTPLVADLLVGSPPELAGPRHGVSPEAAQEVRAKLREMRLLLTST